MQTPDLGALRAFDEIARQGSFARAAVALGVARSSLSETLRALEEQLGVRLLNRTTRSVAPTEAGERLLARLRPLLDDFAAALDSVNAFRDSPAGRLRLTVPPPTTRLVIRPLLAAFLKAHPGIELEVTADSALTDLVRERYDAGIRIGENIDQDMVALRLNVPLSFVLIAAPDYLARRGTPRRPEELRGHDCVRVRFASGALKPWHFRKGNRTLEVAVGGRLVVNDVELELEAARQGLGIVYTLSDYAREDLEAGRVVPLLEGWIPTPQAIFLYYPARRQLPAPLRAFVDFLRREGWLGSRRAALKP